MHRYLLTFFGGNPALKYSNLERADIDARREHRAKWNAWMGGLVESGKLESGAPLASEAKTVTPKGIEQHELGEDAAGGFIVLKADSLDEAARIAFSSPIIKNGGSVLVRACGEIESQAQK